MTWTALAFVVIGTAALVIAAALVAFGAVFTRAMRRMEAVRSDHPARVEAARERIRRGARPAGQGFHL